MPTKKPKKKVNKKKIIAGDERNNRMEIAYQEWLTGKASSLKQLAKKHRLHIPDISRYITLQFELAKIKKENERIGTKFNS